VLPSFVQFSETFGSIINLLFNFIKLIKVNFYFDYKYFYPENTGTFFKVVLLEQPTRISFWAFTLILTFSHPGRRNYFILLFIFFPRPLVGEG